MRWKELGRDDEEGGGGGRREEGGEQRRRRKGRELKVLDGLKSIEQKFSTTRKLVHRRFHVQSD